MYRFKVYIRLSLHSHWYGIYLIITIINVTVHCCYRSEISNYLSNYLEEDIVLYIMKANT